MDMKEALRRSTDSGGFGYAILKGFIKERKTFSCNELKKEACTECKRLIPYLIIYSKN